MDGHLNYNLRGEERSPSGPRPSANLELSAQHIGGRPARRIFRVLNHKSVLTPFAAAAAVRRRAPPNPDQALPRRDLVPTVDQPGKVNAQYSKGAVSEHNLKAYGGRAAAVGEWSVASQTSGFDRARAASADKKKNVFSQRHRAGVRTRNRSQHVVQGQIHLMPHLREYCIPSKWISRKHPRVVATPRPSCGFSETNSRNISYPHPRECCTPSNGISRKRPRALVPPPQM